MRRIEQSVDRQIALLENHQRHKVLHRLGFAVEMDLPKSARGSDGKRYAVAEFPPGKIPYIPVVDAWFVSMALAEELASFFARDNQGKGIDFYPAICTIDLMENMYIYGEGDDGDSVKLDLVCMECGMIIPTFANNVPCTDYFCCSGCMEKIAEQL